jgi:hypothetical protein
MAEPKGEPLDRGESGEDELDRLQRMLNALVSDFAEQHDLPFGALSPMLLNLTVITRMSDYVLSVEKPSASGLKLDLDRLRRELDDQVRQAKRNAEGYIEHCKDELQKAARQDQQ